MKPVSKYAYSTALAKNLSMHFAHRQAEQTDTAHASTLSNVKKATPLLQTVTTHQAYCTPQIRPIPPQFRGNEQNVSNTLPVTDHLPAIDYTDDMFCDIWVDDDPRHTPHWKEANQIIKRYLTKAKELGLKPGASRFMISSPFKMLQVAAKALPNTPPDWKNGLAIYEMVQREHLGLGHIYELVINTWPRIAYLLNTNTPLETKLVIAHVLGHNDFFTRNRHFKHTRPKEILKIVGQHREAFKAYIKDPSIPRNPEQPGNPVKRFIHEANSLEMLINLRSEKPPLDEFGNTEFLPQPQRIIVPEDTFDRSEATRLLHSEDEWKKLEAEREIALRPRKGKFPIGIDPDILGFIAKHSPTLAPWQRHILQSKREEMYYFLPQMHTKIMNEGWASFWHNKLLIEDPETTFDELSEFNKLNSSVLRADPTGLNPYWLGFHIWQYLYVKAGLCIPFEKEIPPEYHHLNLMNAKQHPEFNEKRALEGLYKVCEEENDYTFIEKYLTQELAEKLKLYVYNYENHPKGYSAKISSREFNEIHTQILQGMFNLGRPLLQVLDGNFEDSGELLLAHSYTVDALNKKDTMTVLQIIASMWGFPVHLDTCIPDPKYKGKEEPPLIEIRYTAMPKGKEVFISGRKGREATDDEIEF